MKTFLQIPNGGIGILSDDFVMLQELGLASAAIADTGRGFIVKGCVVSGNTVTSGIVYLNGKCVAYAGGSYSAPFYLSEGTPVTSTRLFKDATTKPAISTATLVSSAALPAGGVQSVLISSESRVTFATVLDGILNAETDWIAAPYLGTSVGQTAFYRKDRGGFVHLSGILGVFNEGQNLTFNLPADHRPAFDRVSHVTGFQSGTVSGNTVRVPITGELLIRTTGQVTLNVDIAGQGSGNQFIWRPVTPGLTLNDFRICQIDGTSFKAA